MRYLGSGLYRASVVVWLFIAVSCIAKPAYAYVDPGSGLFMLQVLGSTFVGFTFIVRKRIRQIFSFIGRESKEAPKDIAAR